MIKLQDYDNNEYKETCECCGKSHSMWTQRDCNPEYYTDVALRCDCGHYVMFKLPVN